MAFDLAGYVHLAKIGKAHGIKGEVKVFPSPGMPTDLSFCQEVLVQLGDSAPKEYVVQNIRAQGKFFVIKFASVDNRNEAELLTAAGILVPESALPPSLGDSLGNSVYWYEYEGCTVSTDTGEELGEIERIFATGAHDIIVVTGKGREYLIPMIDDVIVETDLSAGRIVVSPMPGLLDINS
jgi:16S rRNA processing protein RimM